MGRRRMVTENYEDFLVRTPFALFGDQLPMIYTTERVSQFIFGCSDMKYQVRNYELGYRNGMMRCSAALVLYKFRLHERKDCDLLPSISSFSNIQFSMILLS